MAATACVAIFGYVCLLLMDYSACTATKTEDSLSDGNCITYTAKLTSVPDLARRIVHQDRRHDVLQIVAVKNTDYQRSFYWCQLEVLESDNIVRRYRRFGFNASHWWVEQGCGGWFVVTECKADHGHRYVDLMDNTPVSSVISSFTGNKVDENNGFRKPLTVIDEMYKNWPRMSYSFPSTGQMWETLNNATYVDVAAHLGFYNNHQMPVQQNSNSEKAN